MSEYWVVVRHGKRELLELLTVAFRGRRGFTVITDRRASSARPAHERRLNPDAWDGDDFFVAERMNFRIPE